mgnify:FL=1|jgi:hypothetical protein|tara:strand:+ start:342 stop:1091 length:750 start_codon:yes stop_codon:yes gene_type:complete
MDQGKQYGQANMDLPHDVVPLPSQGIFYVNKKKSLKVGYLTAQDENILLSSSGDKNLVTTLLKNKIYEPDFNINDILDGDAEAILIFLRNTAFGPEYNFKLKDPKTKKDFDATILLDELNILQPKIKPNNKGLFEFNLPKTGVNVICRLLNVGDTTELSRLDESYPVGVTVPIVTKRLEKHVVSIDGDENREKISTFINTLPIMDSKFIRNTMSDCEPKLDLDRTVMAPSGEKVNVRITFGAEFFRPFF